MTMKKHSDPDTGRPSDPFGLPHLEQVFQELRRGRHICPEDGPLYWSLRDNLEVFQRLFCHLGFRLEAHPRDFYYFHGTGSLSDRSERMAVFMFILIEWLSDQGQKVEESLMTRRFKVAELPHLNMERYMGYMKEAGIQGEAGLADVLRSLERYGFLERMGGEAFRFKPPVFRFVDLCHLVLKENQPEKTNGVMP